MSTTHPPAARPTDHSTTRRSVVKGAAWAVPAVTIAGATPALAASIECVSVAAVTVCRDFNWAIPGFQYEVRVFFTNECDDTADISATITASVPFAEDLEWSVSGTAQSGGTVMLHGTYGAWILGWNRYPSVIAVNYTVNGRSETYETSAFSPTCGNPPGLRHVVEAEPLKRPSQEEIRELLQRNPELLSRPEVVEALRQDPELSPLLTEVPVGGSAPAAPSAPAVSDVPDPSSTPDTPATPVTPEQGPASGAGGADEAAITAGPDQ